LIQDVSEDSTPTPGFACDVKDSYRIDIIHHRVSQAIRLSNSELGKD
jgi:hypothetical protein